MVDRRRQRRRGHRGGWDRQHRHGGQDMADRHIAERRRGQVSAAGTARSRPSRQRRPRGRRSSVTSATIARPRPGGIQHPRPRRRVDLGLACVHDQVIAPARRVVAEGGRDLAACPVRRAEAGQRDGRRGTAGGARGPKPHPSPPPDRASMARSTATTSASARPSPAASRKSWAVRKTLNPAHS